MIPHPALGALALMLVSAYEPTVLIVTWADGRQERMAATSPDTCRAAMKAIEGGLWKPVGGEPANATCQRGDLFLPGSDRIRGYNDRGRR